MANTNLQLIKYMKEMQEKHKRHNLPSLRRAGYALSKQLHRFLHLPDDI
ncbi:hypothetical protein GKG47_00740 [Lactonifactor sp. BIOML-A3]|nr:MULTISPECIES: hypothetical protein [unclassified Lactonifactor]MSA00125.1 hypothetical protein [Lactonifactor sp. BIOML-A5]MSA06752.1 hypothetical protein [Lactonifactor sp. BIOML-A4]MSA10970.1 hypothetical protein [Lactonifactor sp. BIOML-A3]MSA15984.1 hypothetical protein [Lactonifactor sp. BIOML-A2]MSA36588.1 hypothetical protein [Lactonifactor sp. BIOML-A1]